MKETSVRSRINYELFKEGHSYLTAVSLVHICKQTSVENIQLLTNTFPQGDNIFVISDNGYDVHTNYSEEQITQRLEKLDSWLGKPNPKLVLIGSVFSRKNIIGNTKDTALT